MSKLEGIELLVAASDSDDPHEKFLVHVCQAYMEQIARSCDQTGIHPLIVIPALLSAAATILYKVAPERAKESAAIFRGYADLIESGALGDDGPHKAGKA